MSFFLSFSSVLRSFSLICAILCAETTSLSAMFSIKSLLGPLRSTKIVSSGKISSLIGSISTFSSNFLSSSLAITVGTSLFLRQFGVRDEFPFLLGQ